MSIWFGLDFGTTNSALAVNDGKTVQIINLNNTESDEQTLRSVLFFDEHQDTYVGQQAVEQYVQFGGMYGRFLQSIKTFLPDKHFTETYMFGQRYALDDLIAVLLKHIKESGEKVVGESVENVMLGRPVFFSEDEKKDALAEERLMSAARKAGFVDIRFQLEPVAATIAYQVAEGSNKPLTVLMGDFGGGTSDFTVAHIDAETLSSRQKQHDSVLSVGGVYIGGDTFDGRIMWDKVTPYVGRDAHFRDMGGGKRPVPVHIMRTLCTWHKIPLLRDRRTLQIIREIKATADDPDKLKSLEALILENQGFMIFQQIEEAKKALSGKTETELRYEGPWLDVNETITRQEFEAMIGEDVDAIRECVHTTISDAGITSDEIDRVLLTGGSSYVPLIRKLFDQEFGKEKVVHLDAFTSVAQGLALGAALKE